MKRILAALPILALTSGAFAEGQLTAIAKLKGPDGTDMGTVTLKQMEITVLVTADLKNVPEGGHGFHIHETGTCAPDFEAAGDHFNPAKVGHGFLGGGPHAGDMPNVFAGEKGRVKAEVFNPRVTLKADADASLFDSDGSAIILHANADSYGKEAGAGDRIACGVITK